MNYTSLISAEETLKHIDDPLWRIVDCRFDLKDKELGFKKYVTSHIPNAVYADLKKDLSSPVSPTSGRHPLPSIPAMVQKLSDWGIDSTVQVIVYDDAFGSFAGRLWWILNWLGHENVAVLNGGMSYWGKMKYPVTTEVPQILSRRFESNPDMSMIADVSSIEKMPSSNKITLIDVRDPERFQGLAEPIDKIAGHVPGAINIPWKSNIDENGLYLPPSQLEILYRDIIDSQNLNDVVFMCGSGVTACHSLVAMKYMGKKGSKLYPGSWSEWIQNPDHGIETGQT